jgi:hypothetical protein
MERQNSGADAASTASAPTRTPVPATPEGAEQRSGAKRRGSTAPATWDASAALRSGAGAQLNKAEALVLMHLCSRANNATGLCWPGIADICATTGVHERNVRKALKSLEDKRLLVVDRLHQGACSDACKHLGAPNRYPNGKPLTQWQGLVFEVQKGTRLAAIQGGGGPGCGARTLRAVAPGPLRAVAPGPLRAVAPGPSGLWRPDPSLSGTQSGNKYPPTTTTQGCGDPRGAETVPRGLRAPAHEPTALRASHPAGSPEGMAESGDTPASDAFPRRPRGSDDASPTPSGEAACADGGARDATGLGETAADIPTPPKTQTQRSRTKESTSRAARAVVAYWARKLAPKTHPLFTTPRLDVVRAWLRMGISPDELAAAVHGASVAPWYTSDPTRRSLAFVLRDQKAISQMAAAGREAGFRRLPRPVAHAGASGPTPSDSRAGSGPAIGRELSITPVNESLQYLEKLTSQLGKGARKELDQ